MKDSGKSHSRPTVSLERAPFLYFNDRIVDGLDISPEYFHLLLTVSDTAIRTYLTEQRAMQRLKHAPRHAPATLMVTRLALYGNADSILISPPSTHQPRIYHDRTRILEYVHPFFDEAEKSGYIPSIHSELRSQQYGGHAGTWLAVSIPNND